MYMSKKYPAKLESIVIENIPGVTDKDRHLTQKEVCGMWLNVGIPYMVKSGRSDQLAQWERDWYNENFGPKSEKV